MWEKNNPKEPQNTDELNLPEENYTLDGKLFVKIIKEFSRYIILFTTEDNLQTLAVKQSAGWWITFKIIFAFLKQLHTIHSNSK